MKNKKEKRIYISQKDNLLGNHGLVYRSSAIFFYKQNQFFKTVISVMDYWKVKRNTNVMLVASLRKKDGTLIDRRQLHFGKGMVINYKELEEQEFEGSLELEIFAAQNLVFPYPGVVAIYSSRKSVSMCHSYSRIYSSHEIEEGKIISSGEESCWTLRDSHKVQSFSVFHNGASKQLKQELKFQVTNYKNEIAQFSIAIPELNSFETYKFVPQEHLKERLVDFLDGHPGNGSLSYSLNGSFTRMLVGNETKDESEFQVTHSNFNYGVHKTDTAGNCSGFMFIPSASFKDYQIVIYPDADKGKYQIFREGELLKEYSSGTRLLLDAAGGIIEIKKQNAELPTRIVTGLSASPMKKDAVLPYECSLGIMHEKMPKKSTFWGVVATGKEYRSRLFLIPMKQIHGDNPDTHLTIKIYHEHSQTPLVSEINSKQLDMADKGLYIDELFPNISELDNGYAYFYFRTESYGGLWVYSTIESPLGSLTIEHSF